MTTKSNIIQALHQWTDKKLVEAIGENPIMKLFKSRISGIAHGYVDEYGDKIDVLFKGLIDKDGNIDFDRGMNEFIHDFSLIDRSVIPTGAFGEIVLDKGTCTVNLFGLREIVLNTQDIIDLKQLVQPIIR